MIVAAHGFVFDEGPVGKYPVVTIFDSLQTMKTNSLVVACCASLLFTQETKFEINFIKNQRQLNGYDCGVFAVAFAMSTIERQNPCNLTYNTRQIRNHLRNCLQLGEITLFPQISHMGNGPKDRNIGSSVNIEVFCS